MSDCSDGSCSTGSCTDGSCGGDRLPPGMLERYNLNRQTGLGTLVWAETERTGNGLGIAPAVIEVLGQIKRMSDDRMFAVITGNIEEVRPLYDVLFSYGVDTLYHIRTKEMFVYHPEAYAEALADVAARVNPAMILIAGTSCGREVAPLTAAKIGTGLTADCTALSIDERGLVMTRPAFGGNIIATIVCDTMPQMATVRPGTFPMPEPVAGRKGTAISRPFQPRFLKKIVSENREAVGMSIADAKVLISLGDGIRDRSLVAIAESVAEKLGGMVCCSRALVEKGWFDHSRQVGQSGRNVSPDLYIAFGISGAVQHLAGIHAKRVIAVNRDENAPIKDVADTFVIGDAAAILRRMDSEL